MKEKILASKHEPYINIEEIGSLLRRLIAGRTTPFVDPRRRSWRTKLSFELCSQIDLNDQMSHVLEHNTSCVDRIFFKLCNGFEDRFDPLDMLKLLEKLQHLYETSRPKNSVALKVEDEDLDVQAYLLTDYALGCDELLIQKGSYLYNEYDLRPSGSQTVRAFIDRILYFMIRYLNSFLEEKSQMFLVNDSGNIRYKFNLQDVSSIESALSNLEADILTGEVLLTQYNEIRSLIDLNPVFESADILSNDLVLSKRLDTLKQEYQSLERLKDLSETISSWNDRVQKFLG